MNIKLIFKTLFIIAMLALLVIMGLHNSDSVTLRMPPLMRDQRQPAALMYFAFFGVGFLCGTILMAGGGKKGGSSSKSKAQT